MLTNKKLQMKQFYKSILYLFLFAVVFLMGCTKDIDIEDQFDFEFEITAQTEGFVYETAPFEVKVLPKRVVTGTTYKLSYVVDKLEAHLETKSPTTVIKASEKYTLPDEHLQAFNYLPTAVGSVVITVTIEDNHGIVKTKTFTYESKYAPFTFLITPNLSTYTINARGAITSTLIRKDEDKFKFKYIVTNGTGIIYDGDIAIVPGEDYELKNGVLQLHYVPSTLGLHKITAIATASDKAAVAREIEVSVDNVPFTLAATAATTSVNANQELIISVDLTEQIRTVGVTYEISHSYDPKGISGIMKNPSGVAIQAGITAPIEKGSYQYRFKPASIGISTITFRIKDSNGQIKEATVVITVENVPFTFTSIPSEKTILLNKNTAINFNLVANSKETEGLTYKLVYTPIEGDGTLTTSGGSLLKSGTPIDLEKGTFTYNYLPKTLGNHKLNFIVTDNNGQQRTGMVEMTTTHTPVSFNVSSVTQTYVNQSIPLNFTITPQNSADLNYKMNYYVSGGEGPLKKGETVITPGNYIEVSKGSFQYNYTPTVAGNYIFTFELKDSNGQIVTKELTVVVLNNKFSFTPTPSQYVYVNEGNVFSYALVPTGNYANTTYNVSYSVDSGQLGTFYQDDLQVQQGIPMKVVPTAFNLIYKPTSVGVHKIRYTVTDSNGLKEDINQEVNVIASGFKFSTQQSNTKIYKNSADQLILSLAQEQANPRISYKLEYSITGVGQILENGMPLVNGKEIVPGNKNYTFISNQSGNSKIEFIITDSNGVKHNQTINYQVVNADFTLSTSGDGSLNLGKSKAINYFISQTVTDNTAQYQVRFLLEGGGVGSGIIQNNGVDVPFGTFMDARLGVTNLQFKGTQVGPVNVRVEVRDNNGVSHSSLIAFSVVEIAYTFTGAAQSNSIFITASTNLNFDISETAPSETEYEIRYTFTKGGGIIRNGGREVLAGQWESVNIGAFNRSFGATVEGENIIEFTVRNKTTFVQKTQSIKINVIPSEYTFSASATSNNEITKTPVNVNFNVNQVGGGADTYTMYFTTNGKGTFVYNNITYTSGQPITFFNGPSSGKYIGTSGGDHDLSFSVINQDGKQRNANVKISYKDNDFSLSSSGDGSLNINSDKNFNVFLSQNASDNAITYEVKYTIASGSIGNGNISKGGSIIGLGEFEPISKGTTQLTFTGTEVGLVTVLVVVKDSNGITHNTTLNFNVKGISYDFSGAPQENTIFVTATTNLNFDISETAASGTNYEMKYSITEGNAEIKNGSRTILANQWENVNIGSYNRTFIGTTVGTIKVLFTVRNRTSLVEKTQLVTVNVSPSDYTFTATGTTNNQTTKTPVNVNFNVNQVGGGDDTYNMTFTTTGTGTFEYNGNTYTAGKVIPFTRGASNGQYIGTTGGVHDITFTIANQNAKSRTATIKLNYNNNDFSLSSSGDGSLNVNSSKTFNVFLSQSTTDNSITYQVKYTVGSGSIGNGTIRKAGEVVSFGTYQEIVTGQSEFDFTGTADGVVFINAEVRDSNGLIHTTTLNFNVKAISYNFSGASQFNSIYINGTTPITFDISETAPSGTNYDFKYELTQGNAEIKNGIKTMNVNQWESVNVGSFNRTFVGTSLGTIKVLFTVRNKTSLVEKTQLLTIVVNPSDFTFNATRANNDQVVNNPTNINFNLTQTGGNADTYNMVFSTSSTGTFSYNGVDYTAGQIIPIVIGASTGSYRGTKVGRHDLVFTVTNQINIIKKGEVSLNYINNDYTLSSSGDGTMFLNQNKDFNLFIAQQLPDPSITYEVKYSFDQGTVGNGVVTNAGTAVQLGIFHPIALGGTFMNFKASDLGIVNLLIEVKNSNGLYKSTIVKFNTKSADFNFNGGLTNNNPFIGDSNIISFDLSEAVTSGTDYEISYSATAGNSTVKDGSTTMSPFQWYPVVIGNFQKNLTLLTAGRNTLVFTVRNKVTLQTKSVTIIADAYQKPTPVNIFTSLDFFARTGHQDSWDFYMYMEFAKQPGATISTVTLTIDGRVFNLNPANVSKVNGEYKGDLFMHVNDNSGNPRNTFNFKTYSIQVTDSNGITTVTTGIWKNNEF